MAKITTKGNLSLGTELTFDVGAKTFALAVAGNLDNDGIVGKVLAADWHDLWKSTAGYEDEYMPIRMADGPIGEMLILGDGWEAADATTLSLIRDCGLAYESGGTITDMWMCVVQGGAIANSGHQPYYRFSSQSVPTNLGFAGKFNELIKIYESGNFDYRSDGFEIFIYEAGFSKGYYDLVTSQELSGLTYRKYLIPMTTRADAAIDESAPSGSPYSGMTYTSGATTNTINSTSYDFALGEIDANGGTLQQVYDWFQYSKRRGNSADFDASIVTTLRGDLVPDTLSLTFAGGILTTSQGLTIKNVSGGATGAAFANIVHVDDTGTGRQQAATAAIAGSGMAADGADILLQISNESAKDAPDWQATTAYAVGDRVLRTSGLGSEQTAGLYFVCTGAGTSGGTEPTWNTTVDGTTSDGTVTWTTYAILYYDDDPAGTTFNDNYTDGEQFEAGDNIRIRWAEMNGATSFKRWDGTAVATSAGFSFVVVPTAVPKYATNAVDGSALTKFAADFAFYYIGLVADSDFSLKEAYAYYCYTLTLSQGMYLFWGGVEPVEGGYFIDNDVLNLYFDETVGAFIKQDANDNERVYRRDGNRPALDPTTGGYGIEINWKLPVNTVETGVSGLTGPESAKLMGLPSAAEVVNEWESQSQADPTGFWVNVKEINGATVQGDGTDGDAWRGDGVDP